MAVSLSILVNFSSANGDPVNALITDANGNLFGTTMSGGAGTGTVFEIVKTASGYDSIPTTLVSFEGINNGHGISYPQGGLIADANGDLFGTTVHGGATAAGTVFEIVKTASGYASTFTTLVSFNDTNGYSPESSLIFDANGNLFGTTVYGGTSGSNGTVFEIVKTASGYATTTLVSFNGLNGANPSSSLIADANGNLFGTTASGGTSGSNGTVFEIVKTASGYASAPTTLVSFHGPDGSNPHSSLIADANGNLFGTTFGGGGTSGSNGTVFEIVKTASGYASAPTTLVSFHGPDGSNPYSSLIADANGNLFGTTNLGGAYDDGTVFEIVKTASGYASAPTTLVSFNGSNGKAPYGSLMFDANGDLLGTTSAGGAQGGGTVFKSRSTPHRR